MNTTSALVILGGVLVFGVVAVLIVKQVDSTSQFGDLTGLIGAL